MMVYVTDQLGTEYALDGIEGWRLMEVIRDHRLPIKGECGGACACATCHVYVDEPWCDMLFPPSQEEIDQLDGAFDVRDNSRLSCQIILDKSLDGMKATLAPGSEP
jgi:2Fe-2S ferredoxin